MNGVSRYYRFDGDIRDTYVLNDLLGLLKRCQKRKSKRLLDTFDILTVQHYYTSIFSLVNSFEVFGGYLDDRDHERYANQERTYLSYSKLLQSGTVMRQCAVNAYTGKNPFIAWHCERHTTPDHFRNCHYPTFFHSTDVYGNYGITTFISYHKALRKGGT